MTSPEDWRRKYFDAIRSMEVEERQLRDVEKALRQVAGRLCLMCQGQSVRLDDIVRELGDALRQGAGAQVLEALGSRLVAAVNERDQQAFVQTDVAPGGAGNAPVALDPGHEQQVRIALGRIMAPLGADPELAPRVAALDLKLESTLAVATLPGMLDELALLLEQRLKNLARARQALENLLAQMIERLDDMGSFVADQHADQATQMESSAVLKTQVAGEMQALGEGIETGVDLDAIRAQLRLRLDAIDHHLQAFRDREAERVRASRMRSEQMRERVEQLEGQARSLQERLQDQQRLSSLDALTQVPNRLAFEQRFAQELVRSGSTGQPACLVLWDIDHFKSVNDRYGHRAGDKVLRIVADTLASGIRSTDFLARYGGEEFVMLLPGAHVEHAVRVSETLRRLVEGVGVHFRGAPVQLTISCGITALCEGDAASDAFDRADKALYAAKDGGRNRCVTA